MNGGINDVGRDHFLVYLGGTFWDLTQMIMVGSLCVLPKARAVSSHIFPEFVHSLCAEQSHLVAVVMSRDVWEQDHLVDPGGTFWELTQMMVGFVFLLELFLQTVFRNSSIIESLRRTIRYAPSGGGRDEWSRDVGEDHLVDPGGTFWDFGFVFLRLCRAVFWNHQQLLKVANLGEAAISHLISLYPNTTKVVHFSPETRKPSKCKH